MRPQAVRLKKEIRVERHAAIGPDINFGHPSPNAVRVELFIPRRVEAVGEVRAPAVATELHHLRPAVQWLVWLARVCAAVDDAAKRQGAHLFRVEWIGDVVPDEFAKA